MTTARTKFLTSSVYSPTNPSSESAIRGQIDGSIDEVFVNLDTGKAEDSAFQTHKTSADHDGRYYTETELNNGQLDTRYYTETEVNALLAAITVGGLSPDSITDYYLKQTGNNILPNFNAHVADYLKHTPYVGQTAGTGNAYTVTATGLTAYVEGCGFAFMANRDSTGNTTINANGLGAKSIVDSFGNIVTNIKQYVVYQVRYNGTNFILLGKGGGGTATAGDILNGLTATVNTGLVTGSLTLNGTAGVGDVISGKTFYNTDAKTIQTGTGANSKRYATGTTSFIGGVLTVNSLNFTPSVIVVEWNEGTTRRYVYKNGSLAALNATYYYGSTCQPTGGSFTANSTGFVLNSNAYQSNQSTTWTCYE